MLGPDQELSFKLDSIVFKTLGESASRGLDQQFDMERARSSLEFFRSQQVPSVDPALPAGVSGVRFDSNLDGAAPIGLEELRALGPLCAAAVPVQAVS